MLREATQQSGPWIWVMAFTALVLAGGETALPAVLGRAVDAVTGHHVSRSWVEWCGLLVVLLIITDMLDDLASGTMTATSTAWMRRKMVGHVLRLSPRTNGLASGDVVNRIVGNTADVGRIGSELVRAAVNVVPALGGMIALGLINIWLLVTFLLGLPVGVLIVRSFAKDASELSDRYLHLQGQIAGNLADALGGARTIAAAGTHDREFTRILAPLPNLHRAGMAMWRAQTKVLTRDALLVPVVEVAVLAVAGVQVAHGDLTTGEMLAAGQYVVLAAGFSSAVGVVQRLSRSRAAARRVAEILRQPSMVYGKRRLLRGSGHVEFRAVTVKSEDGVALEGLDLDIPAGTLVAVVGASGSGKSTLAAVAGRLIDPDEGEVLIDGVAVKDLSHIALRKAVTYAFERPALIGATVGDVVAFGTRRPTFRQIVDASRAARAHSFIQRLPRGYQTPFADLALSGGEIQRLGLARVFAHAGQVVVLDDVVSRLDTVTEHHITKVLTRPRLRQTRIVVAHRESTAARADLVVWMERGRVRSSGKHEQLLIDPGYRRLFLPGRVTGRMPVARQAEKTIS